MERERERKGKREREGEREREKGREEGREGGRGVIINAYNSTHSWQSFRHYLSSSLQ